MSTPEITAADKAAEAKAELRHRTRNYARMVRSGRMPRELAERKIAIMGAIARDYEQQAAATQV
ncbi:hypothetical protein KQX64_06835 [Rhodopseudomonas palustris]|nr:hypothetical protein KQX64_06835 [Rhodopseudomonas palustris]